MKVRLVAILLAVGLLAVALRVARLRDDRQRILEASQALQQISRMQEAHLRLHGNYTEDLGSLADMTDDWYKFMHSLNVVLDLRAGFKMTAERGCYRIEAHARDTKRTPVRAVGPEK